MPSLDAQEYNRRHRVVSGWWYDERLTKEEERQIQHYLEGISSEPPKRWLQIDKAMS